MSASRHFEVVQTRSESGRPTTQRLTLKGLGLTGVGKRVYLRDTPAIRGMLYKVSHMITVTPHEGEPPLSSRAKARSKASEVEAAPAAAGC